MRNAICLFVVLALSTFASATSVLADDDRNNPEADAQVLGKLLARNLDELNNEEQSAETFALLYNKIPPEKRQRLPGRLLNKIEARLKNVKPRAPRPGLPRPPEVLALAMHLGNEMRFVKPGKAYLRSYPDLERIRSISQASDILRAVEVDPADVKKWRDKAEEKLLSPLLEGLRNRPALASWVLKSVCQDLQMALRPRLRRGEAAPRLVHNRNELALAFQAAAFEANEKLMRGIVERLRDAGGTARAIGISREVADTLGQTARDQRGRSLALWWRSVSVPVLLQKGWRNASFLTAALTVDTLPEEAGRASGDVGWLEAWLRRKIRQEPLNEETFYSSNGKLKAVGDHPVILALFQRSRREWVQEDRFDDTYLPWLSERIEDTDDPKAILASGALLSLGGGEKFTAAFIEWLVQKGFFEDFPEMKDVAQKQNSLWTQFDPSDVCTLLLTDFSQSLTKATSEYLAGSRKRSSFIKEWSSTRKRSRRLLSQPWMANHHFKALKKLCKAICFHPLIQEELRFQVAGAAEEMTAEWGEVTTLPDEPKNRIRLRNWDIATVTLHSNAPAWQFALSNNKWDENFANKNSAEFKAAALYRWFRDSSLLPKEKQPTTSWWRNAVEEALAKRTNAWCPRAGLLAIWKLGLSAPFDNKTLSDTLKQLLSNGTVKEELHQVWKHFRANQKKPRISALPLGLLSAAMLQRLLKWERTCPGASSLELPMDKGLNDVLEEFSDEILDRSPVDFVKRLDNRFLARGDVFVIQLLSTFLTIRRRQIRRAHRLGLEPEFLADWDKVRGKVARISELLITLNGGVKPPDGGARRYPLLSAYRSGHENEIQSTALLETRQLCLQRQKRKGWSNKLPAVTLSTAVHAFEEALDELDTAQKELKKAETEFRNNGNNAALFAVLKAELRFTTADFEEQVKAAKAELDAAAARVGAEQAAAVAADLRLQAAKIFVTIAEKKHEQAERLTEITELSKDISEIRLELKNWDRVEKENQEELRQLEEQLFAAEKEQAEKAVLALEGELDLLEKLIVGQQGPSLLEEMAKGIETNLTDKFQAMLDEAQNELDEAKKEAEAQALLSAIKGALRIIGAVVGGIVGGGPQGAQIGSKIGGILGEIVEGIANEEPFEDVAGDVLNETVGLIQESPELQNALNGLHSEIEGFAGNLDEFLEQNQDLLDEFKALSDEFLENGPTRIPIPVLNEVLVETKFDLEDLDLNWGEATKAIEEAANIELEAADPFKPYCGSSGTVFLSDLRDTLENRLISEKSDQAKAIAQDAILAKIGAVTDKLREDVSGAWLSEKSGMPWHEVESEAGQLVQTLFPGQREKQTELMMQFRQSLDSETLNAKLQLLLKPWRDELEAKISLIHEKGTLTDRELEAADTRVKLAELKLQKARDMRKAYLADGGLMDWLSNKDGINTQVSALKAEIADIRQELDDAETALQAAQTKEEIAGIRLENARISVTMAELGEQVAEYERQQSQLRKQIAQLGEEIAESKMKAADIETGVKQAQKKVAERRLRAAEFDRRARKNLHSAAKKKRRVALTLDSLPEPVWFRMEAANSVASNRRHFFKILEKTQQNYVLCRTWMELLFPKGNWAVKGETWTDWLEGKKEAFVDEINDAGGLMHRLTDPRHLDPDQRRTLLSDRGLLLEVYDSESEGKRGYRRKLTLEGEHVIKIPSSGLYTMYTAPDKRVMKGAEIGRYFLLLLLASIGIMLAIFHVRLLNRPAGKQLPPDSKGGRQTRRWLWAVYVVLFGLFLLLIFFPAGPSAVDSIFIQELNPTPAGRIARNEPLAVEHDAVYLFTFRGEETRLRVGGKRAVFQTIKSGKTLRLNKGDVLKTNGRTQITVDRLKEKGKAKWNSTVDPYTSKLLSKGYYRLTAPAKADVWITDHPGELRWPFEAANERSLVSLFVWDIDGRAQGRRLRREEIDVYVWKVPGQDRSEIGPVQILPANRILHSSEGKDWESISSFLSANDFLTKHNFDFYKKTGALLLGKFRIQARCALEVEHSSISLKLGYQKWEQDQ